MGIHPEVDGMGVLLQSLVAADSAGVLFTADPRTGNPWRFVLESTLGLACDLVGSAGETPADRFLFQWDSGEVLSRDIARKKTALVPGARGIDIIDIPADQQALPSLTDDLASRIAQVGLQIDRAFGVRVDVEWAVEADTVHIVQARPLTALPEFFPHHLPPHLKDRTWRRPGLWYFMLRNVDGSVTLPIYRDKLITEHYSRDLEVGPVETPFHLKCGAEKDFHGHRYLVEGKTDWPQVPASQLEQYLIEYEPRFRFNFLHTNNTKFPAIEKRTERLENEVKTLAQAIDAILWVREENWGLGVGLGPAQHLAHRCRELLSAFVDEHLPNTDLNDLLSGHHAELDPYQPHVMIAEAEKVSQLLESERDRFQDLTLDELIRSLEAGDAPLPFMEALEESCNRFALVPPWQFKSIAVSQTGTRMADGDPHEPRDVYGTSLRWHSIQFLRLVRSALKGNTKIAQVVEETTLRREAVVAEARQALTARKPDELPRFERIHDWALFWGPALNHRVLRADVPGRRLLRLFRKMREILLATGLVDDVNEVVYFTVDDLKFIAETGDIPAGRRLLSVRRLEYERSNRLVAPAFLGKDPNEGITKRAQAARGEQEGATLSGNIITGKPEGPGRSRGIIRRVESLGQGDDVGDEEDVVVLLNPEQSNNNHVPLLFSMLLRVRALVVPDAPGMWTGHMSQIARECRVPIVRVVPSHLDQLVEGWRVEVDGTRGTVMLLDT